MKGGTPLPPAQAVALRSWSEQQRRELAARVQAAWAGWYAGWMPAAVADAALACRPAQQAEGAFAAWHPVGGGPQGAAWLAGDAAAIRLQLAQALFDAGSDAGSDAAADAGLAADISTRALQDALATLRKGLELGPAGPAVPPSGIGSCWSGALVLQLPCGGQALQLLVDGAACAALVTRRSVPPRPAPVAVPQAMGRRRLRLRVELQPRGIALGQLAGLRPGDVVPLPQPLDAPLRLVLPGGAALCEAWLGRAGSRKAIVLGAPLPSTMPEHTP